MKKSQKTKELFEPMFADKPLLVGVTALGWFNEIALLATTELFRQIILAVELEKSPEVMWTLGAWIFGIIVLIFSVHVVNYRIFWIRLVLTIERFLARKYVTKYIFMDNEEVVKFGVGKMIPLITGGFHDWSEALWRLILDMNKTLFGYLLLMIYISWIDVRLIIPVVVYTIFSVIWIYSVNKKVLPVRRKRHEAYDNIVSYMVKMLMEKFTILKNNKIDQEQKKLSKLYDETLYWGIKTDFWLLMIHRAPEAFMNIFKLVIILLMGLAAYAGNNSFADIAIVMMVMGFMSAKIDAFNDAFKMITMRFDRPKRIIDLFERIPQIEGYEKGDDFVYKKGHIEMQDISFAYKNSKSVFKDFSLDFPGGKKIALVGKSGVGKSTLIKLVLGFAQPKKGKILIDGQDLSEVSLKSYYRHVGYLSQEPGVFDGSIRENLTYGLDNEENVSEDAIWKAVKHAQCEFIETFKEGLETQIGEKGIRLSGGERQRLAIARLFLQDPDMIILDEPTSALDSFSEVKISEALATLTKGKTLIVIAHRLQTVKDADMIYVIGKNSVLESGKHDTLLKNSGEYASMVDLQSGKILE